MAYTSCIRGCLYNIYAEHLLSNIKFLLSSLTFQ